MSPDIIIALVSVGAQVILEGGKIIATFNKNVSAKDLIDALQKSKSLSWPEYTFESQEK